MTAEKQATYAELVRFRSELPEHVLNVLIRQRAWWRLDDTYNEDCEYCLSMMNGDMGENIKQCSHWDFFLCVVNVQINQLLDSLTNEERILFWRAQESPYNEPDWIDLPEGYYAVPDPRASVEEMTYWRRKNKGKNKRPGFDPWPLKSQYGPTLYRKNIPTDLGKLPQKEYVYAWYETLNWPYRKAIVENIAADPIAAQQRFAKLKSRCCVCGKALTDYTSKVYGIGPECRRGVPAEVLANYYRPEIGRAHALVANGK